MRAPDAFHDDGRGRNARGRRDEREHRLQANASSELVGEHDDDPGQRRDRPDHAAKVAYDCPDCGLRNEFEIVKHDARAS